MTNKEKYELNKDEIINQRLSGRIIREIGEDFDISTSMLTHFLKQDGIVIPLRCRTEEYKKQVVDLYNQGYNYHKIAEIVGSNHHVVKRTLLEAGVRWRDVSEASRKWKLNETYFDKIDSPNKAYILGFLFADGYNSLTKHSVRISLQEEDKHILEKMREELESEKPLRYLDFSGQIRPNGYPCKNMYQLEFFGKHICETLDSHGMKQNKSLILQYPECLDKNLHRHFIRGYFDGDGSIVLSQRTQRGIYALLSITSTDLFCNSVKQLLSKQFPDLIIRIADASCHNGVTKVLQIFGNQRCEVFLDWLYKDAEIFLERKYERYLQLKKYLSNKQP